VGGATARNQRARGFAEAAPLDAEMTDFGLGALARPLASAERRSLERSLRELLAWQERLGRFPRIARAPDAVPIVSLYAGGRLLGCSFSFEGTPGERLVRAFLAALADSRYGGISPGDRVRLNAQVAYPLEVRRVSFDAAPRLLAPGAHGVAIANGGGPPALLVPEVAREHELDGGGLLRLLEHKAGVPSHAWRRDGLFLFTTDRVVARRTRARLPARRIDREEAAARFLAGLVDARGAVAFGREPRTGENVASGPMRHGRAAAVIQALATHPAGRGAAERARAWLERELRSGLGRKPPSDWPEERALVAGTLALAKLAGIDVGAPLRELARHDDVLCAPWHAAQVACALGAETPEKLWRHAVRSLEREPRAPWLAMAAVARGDSAVFERIANALAASVREHGPHRGGVGTGVPELALTAVTLEALRTADRAPTRRARELLGSFLDEHQILGDVLPEASAPERTHGAFPLTPVHGFLRADVTAHAVLARRAAS
jgi:AMMECR1 domain-containing protein